MATTTFTASLKQLTVTLLLAATLAGCGNGNSGGAFDDGADVGGGNDDDGSGNGDDNGGDVGDGDDGNAGDGGDTGDGGNGDDGNGGGSDKPTTAIGGTVAGLKSTIILRINDQQLELSNDGAFSLGTELATGSPYVVTIVSQPSFPAQDCTLANGSGTVAGDVTDIVVTCSDLPVAALQAEPGPGHALLLWTTPTDATHFNVYVSTARDCDISNYSACPDGALLSDVSSPLKVRQLRDGKAYFFRVETVHTNGSRGLSNEAGARPDQLVVRGFVNAVERMANGTVYVGGQFDQLGISAGAAAPLQQRTGRLAQPDFAIVGGDEGIVIVNAVASDGAGGWYLGGLFTHVGGVPRRNLAHVFADGGVDPDFDPGPNDQVEALTVFAGRLYVGGPFTTIAAQPRAGVVAFDLQNGQLLDWDLRAQGSAYAFAVHNDTLYIGGDIVSVEGRLFGGLAAVDATGALVKGWRPIVNGAVTALAVSDDRLYAAGDFTTVNAKPYGGIVAIARESGQPVSTWTPAFNGWVSALAASGDTVYVGGGFSAVNGQPRYRLAAIDAAGQPTAWKPIFNSSVDAMAIVGDTIYVGSMFGGLQAIGTDGQPLSTWNPNVTIGSVLALGVADDRVYAGGWGGMLIGTSARRNLAALDSDGALLPWHPIPNNAVFAMASDGDTLYVGGDFGTIDDVSRVRLAAFNADGTLTAWNPGASKTVTALAAADGIVYVGGDFASIVSADGSIALRSRLAAIDAQGQATSWDPHVAALGRIEALAAVDGVVYAGGAFDGVGREPNVVAVRHFAALDATSGLHLPGWEHRFNAPVHALSIHDDVIYIGGDFTGRDNLPWSSPYLDGISLLTGQPLPWDPRVNGPVWALDSAEHLLYFGGEFTKAGNEPRGGLAALKTPFGTITMSEWAPPGQYNVRAIAAGTAVVYVGGSTPAAQGQGNEGIGVAIIEAASATGSQSLR